MPSLTDLTGKEHLSYSSLSTYLDCGERYRLERVIGVDQGKAWWFIGGSAFHTATEMLDRGDIDNATAAWEIAWTAQVNKELEGFPVSEVRAGGKASKQWPNKENADWWQHNGPIMVADYLGWKAASGVTILEIELEFDTVICDVPVRGYIDRLNVNSDGEAEVMDLKSGRYEPASSLQLATYAVALQKDHGINVQYGSYYMARKGRTGTRWALHKYNEDVIGKWYGDVRRGIEGEIFVPHVTSLCQSCTVRSFCTAVGGNPPRISLATGNASDPSTVEQDNNAHQKGDFA